MNGQPTLTVTTGIGLDSNGRHISLATSLKLLGIDLYGVCLGCSATPTPVTGSTVTLSSTSDIDCKEQHPDINGDWYITIEWQETFDDKTNSSAQKDYQMLHTPWLRLQRTTTIQNNGEQLILGRVTLDANGNVNNLTSEGRRYAGTIVGGLQVQKHWVTPAPNVFLASTRAGGMQPLTIGSGLDITVPNATDEIHLERDDMTNFAKVLLGAEQIVARREDGTESVVIDTKADSITVSSGAVSPTSVMASTYIRQNALYMSGGVDWSSLSYNAYRNDDNTDWVFPDRTHPAVILEIDNNRGVSPRFSVWSTTKDHPTSGVERFAIDGNTGRITVSGTATFSDYIQAGGGGAGATSVIGYMGAAGIIASGGREGGDGVAGLFYGPVTVNGTLTKSGGGFKIDHPLDPANKYISHSFVESPDMKNIYDGVAVLDDNGEAVVELPVWVEALNTEFRYQLTCIGGYAPVYIAEKVHDNRFKIAGGEPEMEVSWQVTGIRQDAWANAHRIQVEEGKSPQEQGYYLHPELHGASREQHVFAARYPEIAALLTLPEQGAEVES